MCGNDNFAKTGQVNTSGSLARGTEVLFIYGNQWSSPQSSNKQMEEPQTVVSALLSLMQCGVLILVIAELLVASVSTPSKALVVSTEAAM